MVTSAGRETPPPFLFKTGDTDHETVGSLTFNHNKKMIATIFNSTDPSLGNHAFSNERKIPGGRDQFSQDKTKILDPHSIITDHGGTQS